MSADAPLLGKVALVTGAARRIGAEIASTLHRCGADVIVHYRRSSSDAESLVESLNERRPASATAIAADLNQASEIPPLAEAALAWQGRLDILVNNASSFFPTPLGTITEADWDDLVGSNLKAPLFLAQAIAPALLEARGNIVNIVDIHARQPLRNHPVYGPAKAGLVMLTRSLAKDLAPGVRVNGVAPGAILWPESDMTDATKASIIEQIPLGRAGSPADIAGCVLFFVCDALYMTGQVIAVDGGRSIGW
jgi:pteridine reductase